MQENGQGRGNGSATGRIILSERWRLAALGPAEWQGLAVAGLIAGFLFAMFHYMGNTVENVGTRSAFLWMWSRWQDKISFGGGGGDADYSHGVLIPFVTLGAIWFKRREIMEAPRAMNHWGLVLIVVSLLLHWIGAKMQQTRVSLSALILLLWAFPYYFYGWKVARHLIFPVSYLIFCIPLNFLDTIAFPLRMMATKVAVATLHGVGIDVVQNGSAIQAIDPLAGTERWGVDVANPCSGLRSLLAMTALTAVYAWVTQKGLVKKWLLFLTSIPLAIAGNVARITFIGIVAESFGQELATGLVHSYSGYVVFGVAIVLMVGIGALLNTDVRVLVRRYRSRVMATA